MYRRCNGILSCLWSPKRRTYRKGCHSGPRILLKLCFCESNNLCGLLCIIDFLLASKLKFDEKELPSPFTELVVEEHRETWRSPTQHDGISMLFHIVSWSSPKVYRGWQLDQRWATGDIAGQRYESCKIGRLHPFAAPRRPILQDSYLWPAMSPVAHPWSSCQPR